MTWSQEKWERKATVRSRPKILFDPKHSGHIFPLSRQPLCVHSAIQALGPDVLNYFLIQSFYNYNNDIAAIETRFTNQGILLVTTNKLPIQFSAEQKLELYTVMVDETYHAYVAYDAMLQIEAYTGIKPLPLPDVIQIEQAMSVVRTKLPSEYHDLFLLIAVCIAEVTITKEIIEMMDDADIHPFFQRISRDHYADEANHAGVFVRLLGDIWQRVSNDCKQNIAICLSEFLTVYLGLQVKMKFDKQVMLSIGLSDATAEQVLYDTYGHFSVTKDHPMLKNILTILDKTKVIDQFVGPKFEAMGWLSSN